MSDYALVESRLTQAMTRRGITQMQAIKRVTETALTEVSSVHRHAVVTARNTLASAEGIQRVAGKPLDDPVFQGLTEAYLEDLLYITEEAGVDMLRVINRALR